MTFNTEDGVPFKIPDSKIYSGNGCASISDEEGKLLFYTNGQYVWNRYNEIMSNGSGLFGSTRPDQSVVIVPKPGCNTKYYIFTNDVGSRNVSDGYIEGKGFHYSLLDMDLDSGRGDIVDSEKNIRLLDSCIGNCIAVKHGDGENYWAITHERKTNYYYVYLVDEYGVKLDHIDSIGNVYSFYEGTMDYSRGLQASLSGRKIAHIVIFRNAVELFDFDINSGRFSSSFSLESDYFDTAYGLEFSPDESILYISTFSNLWGKYSALYQLNLNAGSADNIINTMNEFKYTDTMDSRSSYVGALQLGPDYKIYAACLFDDTIGVINNPNVFGNGCNYIQSAIDVNNGYDSDQYRNKNSNYGLPNIIAGDLGINLIMQYDTICSGEALQLKVRVFTPVAVDEFSWSGPDSFYSYEEAPLIDNATTDMSGWYRLQVRTNGVVRSDSVYIMVVQTPEAEIAYEGAASICTGDSLELEALAGYPGDYTYEWSTGETTQNICVSKGGDYGVLVSGLAGCSSSASVTIEEHPLPEAEILLDGSPEFCDGDSLILRAGPSEGDTFEWQDGSSADSLIVRDAGYYYMWVENENGCRDSAGIWVNMHPLPEFTIEIYGDANICEGDTAVLKIKHNGGDYGYKWQDGSSADSLAVHEAGYYYVWVENENGCRDSAGIWIESKPSHEAAILFDGSPEICAGDSIMLKASPDGGEYTFLWQDGSTENYFWAKSEGWYNVKVTNEYNCSDSTGTWIEELEGPDFTIESGGISEICPGDSILLRAESDEGLAYEWQDGTKENTYWVSSEGWYVVWALNENGCRDSAGIWIEMLPAPDAEIKIDGNSELCAGDSTLIYIEPDGEEYEYAWYYGTDFNERISQSEGYLAWKAGIYTAIVRNSSGCKDTVQVEIGEAPIIRISIDTIKMEVGERGQKIYIYAQILNNREINDADIELKLHLNADAFIPDASAEISGNYVDGGGIRRLTLNKERVDINGQRSIVFTLSGRALLGSERLNNIYIDSFIAGDTYLCGDTVNGAIYADGICQFDLRKVETFEPLNFTIKPNPASGSIEIEFSGDYKGNINLKTINVQGCVMTDKNIMKNSSGTFTFSLPTEDLPDGIYNIIVNSEFDFISKPLIILK